METEPSSSLLPQRSTDADGAGIDFAVAASGPAQLGSIVSTSLPEQATGGTSLPKLAPNANHETGQILPDSIASAMAPTSTPAMAFVFEGMPTGAPAYNESWEDSLMEYMLDSRKREAMKKKLAGAKTRMQQSTGVSAASNLQSIPVTPMVDPAQNPMSPGGDRAPAAQGSTSNLDVKLPLTLDNPLRTFAMEIPHAHASNLPLLTHPYGSLYGGPSPFPSHDATAIAADIIDAYEFKHKSAMTRYIHRELNRHVDDLEKKMKARKAARESNERVKKALKELEKERAVEVKAMERWRVDMARKARIKGSGLHKGIGGR